MSDADKQEDHAASPGPGATPTKGKGRGKGRGRGKRKAILGKAKPTVAPKKPIPTGRRGRIKQYTDPHVQAAYERQREVKSTYLAIIAHVKPALEEIAARDIAKLKSDPDAHKRVPEYQVVTDQLDGRKKTAMSQARAERDLKFVDLENNYEMREEFAITQFKNAIDDQEERFVDAQLERLRLLEEMHDLGLPPDLRANDYQYKQLSQKDFEERGTYIAYRGDVVVPYPSRVPGTDMFKRAQDGAAEAAQALHGLAKAKANRDQKVIVKGRGNGIKRRAHGQPDSQPGAKRPTTRSAARAKDEDEDEDTGDTTPAEPSHQQHQVIAPARHIMGLLAAAVDDAGLGDSNAATPRHTPDVEDDDERADRRAMPPRMRTPDPPKGLSDFDEQGAALVQRGPKANNRIAVKPTFQFDQLDIGFRDSTNDHAKIKNPSARGKFLDNPNTDHFYYDPMLWNYDSRNHAKGDLDRELVLKFGVHSKYGLFVPGSQNRTQSPTPATDSHPVVFLTPSGETLHASRSYQAVTTARNVDRDILKRKLMTTVDTFCESNAELTVKAREPLAEEEISRVYSGPSLGLAVQREVSEEEEEEEEEEEASVSEYDEESPSPEPVAQVDDSAAQERDAASALSPLVMAAIMASAEDASTQRAETPVKTISRPYDAIRDVFTSSSAKPQAEPSPFNLSVLAEACGWDAQSRQSQPAATTGYPGDQGHPQNQYQLPQLAPVPAPTPSQMHQQRNFQEQQPQHPQPHLLPPVQSRESHGMRPEPYADAPIPPRNMTTPQPQPPYQHRYDAPSSAASQHDHYPMSMEREMEPRHLHQPATDSMIDPRLRGLDHGRPHSYYELEPRRHVSTGYPPPPAGMHNPTLAPAPPHHTSYAPPPPQPSQPPPRMGYSSSSTILPPLRPPRQFGQAYEAPADANMPHPHSRISSISSNSGGFYPHGPSRTFHNSFGSPEQPPQMMAPAGPNAHYGQPDPAGYRQGALSPTYSSAQVPFQSLAQSPPPATPPQAPASLGPGSSRSRPAFQHYAPVPSPQQNNAKYRKLEPAPIPAHRMGWTSEPQLRTVGYNPTEDIKDYSAIEPLPGRGPTFIRGWNVSSGTKKRGSRGGREDKDEPR